MRLKHLSLINFMGWAKLDIDLDRYSGVTGVLGVIDSDTSHSNGTGKSGLITAVAFALYGKQLAKNMDDFIMQGKGADGFRVALRFEHGGTDYEVIRRKKKGAQQKVQLKNLTKNEVLAGEPETVIRLPLAVWNNTVFSAQGNLAGFVDQAPSVRKDILTEIFGMRNYLDLEAKAREQVTATTDKLIAVRSEAALLKSRLAETVDAAASIEAAQRSLPLLDVDIRIVSEARDAVKGKLTAGSTQLAAGDSLSGRLQDTLAAVSRLNARELTCFTQFRTKFDTARRRVEACTALVEKCHRGPAVADVEAACATMLAARKEADGLRLELSRVKETQAQLSSKEQVLAYRIKSVDAELSKFEALPDTCPTCKSKLSKEHRQEHVQQLTSVKLAASTEKITLDEDIRNNCINLSNLEGKLAKLSEVYEGLPICEERLRNLIATAAEAAAARETISAMEQEMASLDAQHLADVADISASRAALVAQEDELRKELSKFDEIRAAEAGLLSDLQNCERTLAELSNKRTQLAADLQRMTVQQAARTALLTDTAAADGRLAALEDLRSVQAELVKAFGPTGIPTLILENCLTELQIYLDQYMALMSDGRITVKFRTTKVSSTNKTTETLDIVVSDINGERDIALYSGGERVRVYLAVRLALAKLMSQKLGSELGLIVIDEISDLDDSGLNAFIQLLKSIDKEFGQIFLVSHLPELKDAFSGALVLSRDIYGNYTGTN